MVKQFGHVSLAILARRSADLYVSVADVIRSKLATGFLQNFCKNAETCRICRKSCFAYELGVLQVMEKSGRGFSAKTGFLYI